MAAFGPPFLFSGRATFGRNCEYRLLGGNGNCWPEVRVAVPGNNRHQEDIERRGTAANRTFIACIENPVVIKKILMHLEE